MRAVDRGFLLLCSHLGNPERDPLTTSQLRTLFDRAAQHPQETEDRLLEVSDLTSLGYSHVQAQRIISLLEDDWLLDRYLRQAQKYSCQPLCRSSRQYPSVLLDRLGADAPGCLWIKGDSALLSTPMISLVGSRDLRPDNQHFALMVGYEAARQGYTLVSGNARGADRTAQDACLQAGGRVISIVADSLHLQPSHRRITYVSEDGFNCPFSSIRALSRNRIIHCLGSRTFVAQSAQNHGGSWDGTVKNLRAGWSPVFCFQDGSESTRALAQMGANVIAEDALQDLKALHGAQIKWF